MHGNIRSSISKNIQAPGPGCFFVLFLSAVATAAAATTAAAFGIGAANALGAAFLGFINIKRCAAQNCHKNGHQNYIFHTYFFLLAARSAFS